jgi:uncharacterized protein (DUF2062 family)
MHWLNTRGLRHLPAGCLTRSCGGHNMKRWRVVWRWGTFWAFVLPVAQIVVATAHCTWWRANIPAAAAMTMVTNPLTIGFWLWLAYQAGVLVMGERLVAGAVPSEGSVSWLAEFGWPTVLGMGMFAVGGAALGYVGVKLIWRLRIWLKRRVRR